MTARLLLLLLLIPSLSSAQTVTGTLQGTVKDQSGGVLPGTTVSARSRDTGQVRETVTNGAGYYVLPFLPIGGYEVSAALAGFRTIVHQQVAITLNDTWVVDFELGPAPVAETFTVRVEAPPINASTPWRRSRTLGTRGGRQILWMKEYRVTDADRRTSKTFRWVFPISSVVGASFVGSLMRAHL